MSLKRFFTVLAIFVLCVGFVFAQGQSLLLDFIDGDNLTVIFPNGTIYSLESGAINEGDAVPAGSTFKTGSGTTLELKLDPNGTVIKVAKNTTFKVTGLATSQAEENAFSLVSGKVRTVAAKGARYSVSTSGTVAGVRGTDFTMSYEEGKKAKLLVQRGSVEFAKLTNGVPSTPIMVNQGQTADAFASTFEPAPYTAEELASEYEGMDIPEERIPAQAEPTEEVAEEDSEEATEESANQEFISAEGTETATTEEPVAASPNAAKNEAMDKVIEWLGDVMGMEMGSLTINGETWAKVVLQPTFELGKVRLGLYLPIIYSNDLFNPESWYHPAGNDEWNFGVGKSWSGDTWYEGPLDLVNDLALKIKFFEFGKQLNDPFFIKVGSLDTLTIGHGLLMRNYSNSSDFPAIRNVGLNIGVDLNEFGFEALTNNVSSNEIIGTRLYARPIKDFALAIGFSGVWDRSPASGMATQEEKELYGNPQFLSLGLDVDFPIVKSDFLTLRLFADGGGMVPYLQNDITEASVIGGEPTVKAAKGFKWDMLWSESQGLINWGAAGGLMGNVLFIDYRLEYRFLTGQFTPQFFNSSYDRRRISLVKEWANYITGETSVDQKPVMGIYGEAGTSIINNKMILNIGYFWPWTTDTEMTPEERILAADDYVLAKFEILKGLIPIVDISGSVSYEKTGLVQDIYRGEFKFFDEDTVFAGEVVCPIPGAAGIDIAFIFATTAAHEENGSISINDDGSVKIVPTITLETRLGF